MQRTGKQRFETFQNTSSTHNLRKGSFIETFSLRDTVRTDSLDSRRIKEISDESTTTSQSTISIYSILQDLKSSDPAAIVGALKTINSQLRTRQHLTAEQLSSFDITSYFSTLLISDNQIVLQQVTWCLINYSFIFPLTFVSFLFFGFSCAYSARARQHNWIFNNSIFINAQYATSRYWHCVFCLFSDVFS